MVPSWADQLLPQLLMEQFDTLPIQYNTLNICMKEFGSEKIIFDKMGRSSPTTAFGGAIRDFAYSI